MSEGKSSGSPKPSSPPGPPNAAVERASQLVERHLAGFGETFSKLEEHVYFTRKGSALVSVRVLPWHDDAIVEVQADVVEGATISPELMRELLEENHRAVFGKFSLGPQGVVALAHALLGSTLDKGELVAAILAIATAADDWDDRIVAKAGGRTALARLREGVRRESSGS